MRSSDDGLRALFIEHLPHPHHLTPIETGMIIRGVPDLHYAMDDVSGWIECKATSGWTVPLRPSQIGWAYTHYRHGGRVVVAVRRRTDGGPRTESADELWLLHGRFVKQLKEFGLQWARVYPGAVLGHWAGGPRNWRWDEVRAALLCKYTDFCKNLLSVRSAGRAT